jgi:SAM-dependent methyltransferase
MSLLLYIYDRSKRAVSATRKRDALRETVPAQMDRAGWGRSLESPTEFYMDCFRFFHQHLPAELRDHRAWFARDRRVFGEESMHVMWFWLFNEFKPSNFLEIGVYRGQVISLMSLLAKMSKRQCEVFGISPFLPVGDSVSKYPEHIDYHANTLENFSHFSQPAPQLLKNLSTDEPAVALIKSRQWDMIYIDGNHDYEVVLKDWAVCSASLKPGGIVILDDAGLGTYYQPPLWATAGHPGPSRLAGQIDRNSFKEIMQVGHNRVFQKV